MKEIEKRRENGKKIKWEKKRRRILEEIDMEKKTEKEERRRGGRDIRKDNGKN